jgi:prepilin-type processing-associated H-X9-DG protein
MAVIVLLVLFHSMGTSSCKGKARRIACYTNLKQIGLSLKEYSMDYNDLFPQYNGEKGLTILIKKKYFADLKRYICPSTTTQQSTWDKSAKWELPRENCSYLYAGGLSEADAPDSGIARDKCVDKNTNHKRYGNILYLDGHVSGRAGVNWIKKSGTAYLKKRQVGDSYE